MQIIIFVEYCGRKNENEWQGCPPNGYLATLQRGTVTGEPRNRPKLSLEAYL